MEAQNAVSDAASRTFKCRDHTYQRVSGITTIAMANVPIKPTFAMAPPMRLIVCCVGLSEFILFLH
jgi:hypothetical protein